MKYGLPAVPNPRATDDDAQQLAQHGMERQPGTGTATAHRWNSIQQAIAKRDWVKQLFDWNDEAHAEEEDAMGRWRASSVSATAHHQAQAMSTAVTPGEPAG